MGWMAGKLVKCPKCGGETEHLVTVGVGTKAAIQSTDPNAQVPDQICSTCLEALGAEVSQGAKLRMERDLREKNKMMMWKNRVHLIKNARSLMSSKAYPEAAVKYEKYLRVLEVVYNLNKGEVTPKVFNNSSRSKELTVVTSVYWDLVRIYDISPQYRDRMQGAAKKLAEFLPYSQIYPDVTRKANNFLKSAKNPDIIRSFLRASRAQRGMCFIATAAFADQPEATELLVLRRFRDQALRPSRTGRQIIYSYYKISPPIARLLARHPRSRLFVKQMLIKISRYLQKSLK